MNGLTILCLVIKNIIILIIGQQYNKHVEAAKRRDIEHKIIFLKLETDAIV